MNLCICKIVNLIIKDRIIKTRSIVEAIALRSRENSHEASDPLTYLDDGDPLFSLPPLLSQCSYHTRDFPLRFDRNNRQTK